MSPSSANAATLSKTPSAGPHGSANGAVASRAGQNGHAADARDALIQELTAQLEQAAEQLDRLQRTGADRRRGVVAGGLPADLIDEHRQTVGELQRVVQQWDDMQAGQTLGRIEIQLTELREFIAARLDGTAPVERHAGPRVHEESSGLSSRSTPAEESAGESPADSEWARLKSQLLADDGAGESAAPVHSGPLVLEPLPEPPDPVDLDHAEREYLELAILARDEYITTLIRRLRAVEVAQPVADLLSLGADAPEFVQRVTDLERQLQEQLRLAEVELSLERGKFAREQAQLHQQQELVEKQLKKLGLQSADDIEPGRPAAAANPDRRWRRFLGNARGD